MGATSPKSHSPGSLSHSYLRGSCSSSGTLFESSIPTQPKVHDAPPERHLVTLDRHDYNHHAPRKGTMAVDIHRWLAATQDGRIRS
jgi:hypothetical protein